MSWVSIVENNTKVENNIHNKNNKIISDAKKNDTENADEIYNYKSYDDEFFDTYQSAILKIKKDFDNIILKDAYPFLDNVKLFTKYSLSNLIINFSLNYEEIMQDVDYYNESIAQNTSTNYNNDIDLLDEY